MDSELNKRLVKEWLFKQFVKAKQTGVFKAEGPLNDYSFTSTVGQIEVSQNVYKSSVKTLNPVLSNYINNLQTITSQNIKQLNADDVNLNKVNSVNLTSNVTLSPDSIAQNVTPIRKTIDFI